MSKPNRNVLAWLGEAVYQLTVDLLTFGWCLGAAWLVHHFLRISWTGSLLSSLLWMTVLIRSTQIYQSRHE